MKVKGKIKRTALPNLLIRGIGNVSPVSIGGEKIGYIQKLTYTVDVKKPFGCLTLHILTNKVDIFTHKFELDGVKTLELPD